MDAFNLNLIIELLFLALAVSRLSNGIVSEAGIFHSCLALRHALGLRHIKYHSEEAGYVFFTFEESINLYKEGELDEYRRYPTNTFSELVNCYWCTSIWVILIFLFLRVTNFDFYFFGIVWFSVSAISIYLKEKIYT